MDKNYIRALKMGQKNYRACVSKGEYPYLPVLDDFLPVGKQSAGVDIGIHQIPMDFIVGTKTKGRTLTFAKNFMPLADEKSEFAGKWSSLCATHEKEGIREPIVVCEYMNRFYVVEGNKRVSVLKYFDAVSVPARVKRILPDRNGTEEVERYFKFLELSKLSNVNYLEFSKIDSYTEFQKLVGKEPNEKWTEDETMKFKSLFHYAKTAYLAITKNRRPDISVGDALLVCIRIYGYEEVRAMNVAQLKKSMEKVWQDIYLQREAEPIEVKLTPDEPKQGIFTAIEQGLTGPKVLSIAFIYSVKPQDSSWVYGHELGRTQVEERLKGQVRTKVYVAKTEETESTIDQAVKEGASVVFATDVQMLEGALKAAVKYPNVTILNCTINKPHRYIRTYYARLYEAKFITGIIAGSMATEDKIGYICKYPIYGCVAEINAFAKGVAMVRPTAKVYLEWSSLAQDVSGMMNDGTKVAERRLVEKGINLISYREFTKLKDEYPPRYGLEQVIDGKATTLVLPIVNWGIYYEKLINSIMKGTYQSEDKKTAKALNYYWGISTGVVDMVYSTKLPTGVRYLAEGLYQAIAAGHLHPFYTPKINADGTIQWDSEHALLSMSEVISMDYLEENVVGSIPKIEELDEKYHEIIKLVGVESARPIED